MTLRFHPRLAAIALVGLAVCSGDARGAAAEEHERRSRPALTVPSAGLAAWPAHAQRIARAKPATPRRRDRLPRRKKPRLGQEPGTAVCTNTIPLSPIHNGSIFNGDDPLGMPGAWVAVHQYSPISDSYPCQGAQRRATFPSDTPNGFRGVFPALQFSPDAVLVVCDQQRYFARPVHVLGQGAVRPGEELLPRTARQQLVAAVDVMTPRELYAAAAACPYCPLGNIRRARRRPADVQPRGSAGRGVPPRPQFDPRGSHRRHAHRQFHTDGNLRVD